MTFRLFAVALASAAVMAATGAGPASAASEQFMTNQGLSAGNAKASVGAHSGSNVNVFGSSDHTWCPALARGYAGYTSTPNSGANVTSYRSGKCGPGYSVDAWDTNGYAWHGAALNPNGSTFDNFSYASVIW